VNRFFGIFGASFIFGLCTWILGFLATYEYLGSTGVFVGLVSGIVGIVPVGILAALFHADWTSAIFLTIGLVLTCGARSFAMWLAIKIGREASHRLSATTRRNLLAQAYNNKAKISRRKAMLLGQAATQCPTCHAWQAWREPRP
jgi:hypothetical protein